MNKRTVDDAGVKPARDCSQNNFGLRADHRPLVFTTPICLVPGVNSIKKLFDCQATFVIFAVVLRMFEKLTIRRMSQKNWQDSVVESPANRNHVISGDTAKIVPVVSGFVPAVLSNQVEIKFFWKIFNGELKTTLSFVQSKIGQVFAVMLATTFSRAKHGVGSYSAKNSAASFANSLDFSSRDNRDFVRDFLLRKFSLAKRRRQFPRAISRSQGFADFFTFFLSSWSTISTRNTTVVFALLGMLKLSLLYLEKFVTFVAIHHERIDFPKLFLKIRLLFGSKTLFVLFGEPIGILIAPPNMVGEHPSFDVLKRFVAMLTGPDFHARLPSLASG